MTSAFRLPNHIEGAAALRWEDSGTWHAFDDLLNAVGGTSSGNWTDISRTRKHGYFARILDTADTIVSDQEGADKASLYYEQIAVGKTLRSAQGTVLGEVANGPAVVLDCLRSDGSQGPAPVSVFMGRSALDQLLVIKDYDTFMQGRQIFDPRAYLELFARLAADPAPTLG